jgi:NADPH:quinone reductase-like Zn-dependent oxidoreductase
MMKAIIYRQYGPPDVLALEEVEKPVPQDDEVLVRIKATSVNRTDCANLRAKPDIMRLTMGLFKPKNPILGTEFAGDIEAVGKAVTGFKVKDRVFGFDDSGLRSYAEYLTISSAKAMAIMPDAISYEEATACIEGAHYAYNFINKVSIKSGSNVLVNGASGGIGSATVQLLQYLGAEITGVCSTSAMALVKSLGAGRVIDYTVEDFTEIDEKYDFIFDSVGKSTFGKCKALLNPGGVYISSELGPWGQNLFLINIGPITSRYKSFISNFLPKFFSYMWTNRTKQL